jgi:DNA-binding NarL/FixJ family response regulator
MPIINYRPNQRPSQMTNGYHTNPAIELQTSPWPNSAPADGTGMAGQTRIDSDLSPGAQPSKLADMNLGALTIGLIDFYRLTQECLTTVFDDLRSEIVTVSFTSVKHCIAEARSDLDLILYYLHGSDAGEATIMQAVTAVCQAFPATPVIVFSDADCVEQSKIMRATLKCGARGFVPTQTATLSITLAAIRLVKAGGTFVPVDLLLAPRTDRVPPQQNRLTSRQGAVLNHLQQGKANKIIAYELGMSESTVKVHVRNIMHKMGATNRTQAAYNARRLASNFEGARTGEA